MSGNQRQYILLGVLVVALLAYFRFSGSATGSGDDLGSLPPVDVAGLARSLQNINTVRPTLIGPRADSNPDRNLFKYGVHKPPPPDPAELERRRLAAEQALMRQEERARALKRQQDLQAKKATVAKPPTAPPKPKPDPGPKKPAAPKPPPIKFKFMGIVGTAKKRIGVFVNGENLMLARKGTILEEQFKVLGIGVAWADIGYTDPVFEDKSKRVFLGL